MSKIKINLANYDVYAREEIAIIEQGKRTLAKLALDSSKNVRLAVARNPNTSKRTLAKLAFDICIDVRIATAKNPHTPKRTLKKLYIAEFESISSAAKNNRNNI